MNTMSGVRDTTNKKGKPTSPSNGPNTSATQPNNGPKNAPEPTTSNTHGTSTLAKTWHDTPPPEMDTATPPTFSHDGSKGNWGWDIRPMGI
mmetsp:Transcript_17028/g.24069  ORF Transcript_17028/g.24069 Transcript_17028/m.24069 type:complete len:91 (+) Transcript_17028:811-1083(+)